MNRLHSGAPYSISLLLIGLTLPTARAGDCTPVHLRTNGSGTAPTCWDEQDETCTDGNNSVPSFQNGGFWGFTSLKLERFEPRMITDLNGVGGRNPLFWEGGATLTINVHSAADAFANDPFNGDVVNNHPASLNTDPPALFGGMTGGAEILTCTISTPCSIPSSWMLVCITFRSVSRLPGNSTGHYLM